MRSLFGVLTQSVLKIFPYRSTEADLVLRLRRVSAPGSTVLWTQAAKHIEAIEGFLMLFCLFCNSVDWLWGLMQTGECSTPELFSRSFLSLKNQTVMNLFRNKTSSTCGPLIISVLILPQMGSLFSKCKNEQSLSEERDHADSLKIIYSLESLQDNTGQPGSLLGRLGARILASHPKLLG